MVKRQWIGIHFHKDRLNHPWIIPRPDKNIALNPHFMRNTLIALPFIFLLSGCSDHFQGELLFVEPKVNDSFYFPYFLFIPENVDKNQEMFLIVEPNNSGFADDQLEKHIEKASRTATKTHYPGHYLAQNLNYPLLVPVFPRPSGDWKIYTHALDRDVMLQKGPPLSRPDLQLLEMIRDVKTRLMDRKIHTHQSIILTGFSASATFTNRFTLLHPDQVFVVAAGGLNGLLMLPVDSLNGERLIYPIGTGDFHEITNAEFQKDLFIDTPQFYYMGELDDNDAVPFDDAFDQEEREQIYRLLGRPMQPDRWAKCTRLYQDLNVNAIIKTYEKTGHENTEAIKLDILSFIQKCISENSGL
ncbi:hypothetical protein BA6E_103112 [Bacteroidales bacterium 6E]|nr:hypothetical protein BA6E_103112 [Bacteroidales bacterium 6E]